MSTRKTTAPVAEQAAETPADAPIAPNPSEGGAYERQPDGTLERVEFTAEHAEDEDADPAEAEAGTPEPGTPEEPASAD